MNGSARTMNRFACTISKFGRPVNEAGRPVGSTDRPGDGLGSDGGYQAGSGGAIAAPLRRRQQCTWNSCASGAATIKPIPQSREPTRVIA